MRKIYKIIDFFRLKYKVKINVFATLFSVFFWYKINALNYNIEMKNKK